MERSPWSFTALSPKIGPMNASAAGFMLIWALHMSWFTFKIAMFGMLVTALLSWFNVSLLNAWGWINYKISGGGMVVHQSPRRFNRRARL